MKRFVPHASCREAYMVLRQHSPKYAKLFRDTRIVVSGSDTWAAWYEDRRYISIGYKFATTNATEQAAILVHELTHKLQHAKATDYNAVEHEIEAFERAIKFFKRVKGSSVGFEGGPVEAILEYYNQGREAFEARVHKIYDHWYGPYTIPS